MSNAPPDIVSLLEHSALSALEWDKCGSYIDTTTNTYQAMTALKLPCPDDDLTFTLSALPASCQNVQSQAILTNRDFKRLDFLIKEHTDAIPKGDEFPSAIRVTLSAEVSLPVHAQLDLATKGEATTNSTNEDP